MRCPIWACRACSPGTSLVFLFAKHHVAMVGQAFSRAIDVVHAAAEQPRLLCCVAGVVLFELEHSRDDGIFLNAKHDASGEIELGLFLFEPLDLLRAGLGRLRQSVAPGIAFVVLPATGALTRLSSAPAVVG